MEVVIAAIIVIAIVVILEETGSIDKILNYLIEKDIL